MAAMSGDRLEQDRLLSQVFAREQRRLLAFIRKRVPNTIDAEDLLQDVFFELVAAYRLMKPVAHAGAWMFEVARNRIADLFRRGRPEVPLDASAERPVLEELLPSPDAGPDALYARSLLLAEIEDALEELPPSQRQVFLAHEIEGRSFARISQETGVGIPTLLSRKHYAVKRLRKRLQSIYKELGQERKNQ